MFKEEKSEKQFLYEMFCKIINKRVEPIMVSSVSSGLFFWAEYGYDDTLKEFVKKYFDMKRAVEAKRKMYVDHIQSTEYKEDRIINKILIRKRLREWNKFCADLNKFEEEFYKRTRISLLHLENERYNEEQRKTTEQTT